MLAKTIQLQDSVFFHARPAAWIASEAKKYQSMIMLTANGQIVDAKKSLAIMRLGVMEDKTVEIISDGSDELEAMQAIVHVLEELQAVR